MSVTAVNDAPVLADTALSMTVAEDAGAPSGAVGSLVSAFTGGITDVDSGAAKGLAITGSSETNGTWYYTTNGGTTWTAVGTVSAASSLLLADNGSTRLYFAPNADYTGSSTAALTVRAWDQTSGTAGTKVSTASTGGTTAFSAATDTIDVSVTAVNDAPTDLSTGIELNTDGGNDAYLISDTGLSQSLTATTVEIRFAANNLPLETVLLSFNNPTGDELSIQLDDPSNNLELDFGSGAIALASAIDYRAALIDGTVHTLSVTWDSPAGNWSIYIDGGLIESGTGLSVGTPLDTTNGQFVFGQEQDGQNSGYDSTQYFSGTFYDVRIWNDVRTAGEIAQYYQQQLDVTPAEAAAVGLLANWQMDGFDGANQVVELVNGNNLSIAHASGTGFTTGGVNAQLSIEENSANGSHVGFVTAEDSDASETFTYSLTDSAGGRFAVNAVTGELTVADGTLLDYDTAISHSVTVRVTDSGGLTYDETFTINLTNVNETPTDLSLSANSVAENAANGTVVGTVSGTDPDSGDTKTYSFTDSAGGRFAINGSTGQITVANSSLLNYEAATSHSVTVRVTDSGGLTYDETFTINVTNVNEAPTGADATVTITEDTAHTFTAANFGFSDVDAGDSLSAVRIDTVPGAGSLTLSGVAVTAGQVITVADITAGNLVFTPAANANGTGYASVTFSVRDSNNAYDAVPNIVTVDVTAVNDAPLNTVPGAQTVAVDTPLTISGLSVSDVDGNLTTVQLSVSNGTVAVTLSGGATILSGASGTSTLTLTGTQADINATLGSLTYQGAALYTGADTLTVLSTDGNGATDTDTVSITVSNNAPTNVLPAPQTVAEDTALAINGLSVTDADNNLASVQLSVTSGTITLTLSGATTVSGGVNGSSTVTLSGTQADLNATLASLVYQGTLNFAGLDTLTITSTDALGTADTDSLSITVTAVNDTPTDLALSSNTVAENAANGTTVGTVSGTDPDSGDTKTYSFTDSAGGRFAINSSTGVITVANSSLLNYEAATSHSVTVRVTDSGGLTYDETFTINLTNVNETPTDLALSSNTVAENAANGTTVGTVSGTDPDSGDTKTYSFTDSAGGRFAINSSTGQITVANSSLLNYEAATSHSVTVRVTDAGGLTYDETFTINLTNVNETPTDLALSSNTVAENAANGTTVGTVSGTDPDSGDTKTYSFTDSAGGRFAINSSTGQITVADSSLLNYEAATTHSVTVRVTDAGGLTYDETFTINLTNVNETPTDLALSSNTVVENAANGTVVGTVSGTDPDSGDTKAYSFTDSAGGRFAINSSTGQITVADGSLLDYEAATSHSVTVRVTDAGGLTYDETFTINLTNVNEAPTGADATVTINEDTSHTVTTANFGFSDVDAGDSLSAVRIDTIPTAGTLTLSGVTVTASQVITVADITAGNLVFTPAADANGTGYARVTFSVRDSNNTYDTAPNTLTFDVTVVNDAPTDLSLSANTVAENAANGTVIGTASTTDPDASDTHTYQLTDDAGGRFAINSSTGEITVADGSLLDYEAATSHSVTVRVTDTAGLTYAETFTINLTDVNETPTDLSLSANTVAENAANGTSIGTVSGTDPDSGDTKTYSFTDSAGGRFAINSSTGEITVADGTLLDYESATSHSVTVRVTDAGGLTYDETVTINLTNVNEAPTGTDATVTINEDTSHTLTTANFGFSDVDAGDSLSSVRIETLPGAGGLTLSGVPVTVGQVISVADITAGNLVFTPVADATGTGYASFTFSVRDSGNLDDSGPNTLTFDVTAVNDAPINTVPGAQTVDEDTPITITGLSVNDVDDNLTTVQLAVGNGALWVSLAGGATISAGANDSGTLTLSGTQAQINTALATVTYQGTVNFTGNDTLIMTSTDSTSGTDVDTVAITVTAVNDVPTDLSLSANTVAENAANGTVIGTASTTDPDASDTHTYQLTDDAGGRFAINSSTGEITVADGTLLDYESATSHSVTVRVTDAAGLTYDETFTINLTDVNETTTDLSLSANTVAENAANGTSIGTVSGTDSDSGDTHTYQFTDDAGGRFAINSSTGEITVADGTLLDYESATSHSVTVRVTDAGGLTYDETFTINLTNVNEAPSGVDATVTINEDTSHVLTTANFGFSDVDAGDSLSAVRIETLPGAGGLTLSGVAVTAGQVISAADITAGNLVFTPAADATGTGYASVTFSVRDSNNAYDAAPNTLTFDVTAVNDVPVVTGGTSGSGSEDSTLTGTLTATDADGLSDGSVFTVTTNATNGTAGIDPATGLWSYTPNPDYHGTDSFTVTITDDMGNSSTQVISVTVTPVADLTDDSLITTEDSAISANVLTGTNGATSDSFEGTPVLTSVTQGTNGSVTFLADGTVTYTPNTNFNGTDSFTYTIMSGGVSETATVTVTVTAVNDAPTGTDATITINEDTAYPLTAANVGFSDVDAGDTVSAVRIDTLPGAGSLTLSGVPVTVGQVISVADITAGNLVFTPAADANGTGYASFTFSVRDSTNAYDVAPNTLTFNVTAVNDAPTVAVNSGSTVVEGGSDTIDSSELAVTDIEQAAAQLTYSIGTGPAYGRLELTTAPGVSATSFTQADIAANRLIYLHNGSETTSDSFTFTVNDGAGGTLAPTTMTLTITPVNDTPTITSNGGGVSASINVAENVSAVTIVTGSDVDLPVQALTYSISGGLDQALFTINTATGVLSFTAPPDFEVATDANGDNVYVVQVQVVDSQGASTTQTIQVTVTNVVEGVRPPPTVPPILLSPIPPPPSESPTSGPETPPPVGPVTRVDSGPVPTPVLPGSMVPPLGASVSGVPLTLVPPPDRPVVKIPDEVKHLLPESEPDKPIFFVNDEQGRPLFSVLPVEPTPTLEPEPPEPKPSVSDLLLTKLDEMTVSLERAMNVSQEQRELVARVTAVTGATLSVGFIAWALRSGAIMASLLATMPAWQHFDPLPVVKLSRHERTRRRDAAARDQQQEAAEFKGLNRVLDHKPPLKRTA